MVEIHELGVEEVQRVWTDQHVPMRTFARAPDGVEAMTDSLRRVLWLSQIALSSLLVLCSVMTPSVAASDGGVSNFGNRGLTVVPYTASFSLSALFLAMAARRVSKLVTARVWLPGVLVFLGLLDLLVLISTYPRHASLALSEIHDDLGIALFAYEFVLTIWFVTHAWRTSTAIFFVIEIGGSLVGLLSVLKIVHLLYWGQMVGGVGFALLLVTIFPLLVAERRDADSGHYPTAGEAGESRSGS